MVTAKQLIEMLQQLPPDGEVFIYNSYWLEPTGIEPKIVNQPWTDNKPCIMEEMG